MIIVIIIIITAYRLCKLKLSNTVSTIVEWLEPVLTNILFNISFHWSKLQPLTACANFRKLQILGLRVSDSLLTVYLKKKIVSTSLEELWIGILQ